MASSGSIQAGVEADDQYLLLADISGFTAFLASVERAHGVDFDTGLPAGFGVLGALLGAVIEGVEPDFTVAKLEGDAVFAVAPATDLDAHGDQTLARLRAIYGAFLERREERAQNARDHVCDACPVVATLDLKMVLHRGRVVRQAIGSQVELLGPAVNIVHRLLKNNVYAQLGYHPYLLMTDAAATGLDLAESGVEHSETYADVGDIHGRVVGLAAEA